MKMLLRPCVVASVFSAASAQADLKVGVLISLTGYGAALGAPARNAVELLPTTLGGQKVEYIVADDTSDTTVATRQARRFVEELHVDAIIGTSITPTSLAVLPIVGASQTPLISLSGSGTIIVPQAGDKRWAFKLAPNESTMGERIFADIRARKFKTLAYVAFSNAYGESFVREMNTLAGKYGVKVVADERYGGNDTSVTSQVLKILAARPDAVFIAAASSPAALPLLELKNRGYAGQVYLQQGVASADFLRLVGRNGDGALLPVAPVLVAEQLPDSNPVKKPGVEFTSKYEAKFGAGTRSLFGATLWDAYLLLDKAVPAALKVGQPGTAPFRTALRDSLEKGGTVVGTQAVFSLTETDHNGTDDRSQVLVKIDNGRWLLTPQAKE